MTAYDGAAGEIFSLCCIFLSSLPSELVHLIHCHQFLGRKVRQFPYPQGKRTKSITLVAKILYPGTKSTFFRFHQGKGFVDFLPLKVKK